MTPQTNEEIRNLVLEEHGFSKTLPELLIIAMSYKDTRIHSLEAGVEELKKALDHWTLMHIQESARSAKLEANLKIAVEALERIASDGQEAHTDWPSCGEHACDCLEEIATEALKEAPEGVK